MRYHGVNDHLLCIQCHPTLFYSPHHPLSTDSVSALLEWTLGPLWKNKAKDQYGKKVSVSPYVNASSTPWLPHTHTGLCPHFHKKGHMGLISSIFHFSYNLWHGNELTAPISCKRRSRRWQMMLFCSLPSCICLCLALVARPPCNSMYQAAMNYTCIFWSSMKVLPPIKLPGSQI